MLLHWRVSILFLAEVKFDILVLLNTMNTVKTFSPFSLEVSDMVVSGMVSPHRSALLPLLLNAVLRLFLQLEPYFL